MVFSAAFNNYIHNYSHTQGDRRELYLEAKCVKNKTDLGT